MIRKVLSSLLIVGSIVGVSLWYSSVHTLMLRGYNLTRMWRVLEITNKDWLLVFSLITIGACSGYLLYRLYRRYGTRVISKI